MNKFGQGILQLALKPVVRTVTRGSQKMFSRKYLIYTNTGICVGLSCVGDILQQSYQIMNKKKSVWDKQRTFNVSATGLVLGPFCHLYYLMLEKWFPGRTLRIVIKKMLVDQIFCSPIFIAMFLVSLGIMERHSWSKIKSDLWKKGTVLYTAEWLVWPPAQTINFLFLPMKYRVLYDNTICLGLDCYYSYVRYDKDSDAESDSDKDSEEKVWDVVEEEEEINSEEISSEVIESEDVGSKK